MARDISSTCSSMIIEIKFIQIVFTFHLEMSHLLIDHARLSGWQLIDRTMIYPLSQDTFVQSIKIIFR